MNTPWRWTDFRDWRTQLLALALFSLTLALLFQGNRGLWGADEGRYSNVALQMLESGDWLTPHRHPDHIEYARPPLTYWAIAASVAVFGKAEWTLRLPSALAFFGTSLLVFFLARRLCPKRPWLPPLIYATNLVPFLAANYISADSLLTFFETLGVWAFVCMWQAEDVSQARNYRRLMWAAFALAFLCKGPAALLPLLALMVFRRFSGLNFPCSMVGFDGPVTFLLISVPWFIWMFGRGETSGIVEGNQALIAIRGSYRPLIELAPGPWYGPIIDYGPILLSGLLPWGALALVLALTQYRTAVTAYFSRLRLRRFRQIHQESVFLVNWFLLPLAILFLVQVRLWLYVLPLLVPMTLAIGRAMQGLTIRRWMALALALWMILILAIKGFVPAYENKRDAREIAASIKAYVVNPNDQRAEQIYFFETTPLYGLKFYLGSNLLRVADQAPRDASFDLRMEQVFQSSPKKSQLWITELNRLSQFQAALARFNLTAEKLHSSDNLVLLRVPVAAQ